MSSYITKFIAAAMLSAVACGGGGALKYNSAADWVAKSQSGVLLVLAPEAGKWSDEKIYTTGGGTLAVQSKFLQHKGTTCEFEIKATNTGSSHVNANMALVKIDQATNHEGRVELREHRFARVELAPGEARVWEMEARECPLHFGSTTDMKACAECGPVLGFN